MDSLTIKVIWNKYSGTRLIWTPRGHAKVSVLTGVHINQVNFRENVRAFPHRDKQNCPQYLGVRIKRVSVERGSTVQCYSVVNK